MYFGLNESMLQKLIDFTTYYYHQVQMIAQDLVDAKVNVRNMLVYFNHIVLKLAVNNPNLQAASSPQVTPLDSDNAKSHLAKMQPDVNKLLEYLDTCDDSKLLLQNIQKHLEEGKFKLPIDTENQTVQDFASEDVVASLKLLQAEKLPDVLSIPQGLPQLIPSLSTGSNSIKRTTSRRTNPGVMEQPTRAQPQLKQEEQTSTFQIIPLKTLTTRMMDLIHK